MSLASPIKMPYSQSKKLTDSEKKIQALKLQLYGKDVVIPISQEKKQDLPTSSIHQDTAYLKKDLLKIFFLALLAIATQFGLYFAVTKGWLDF